MSEQEAFEKLFYTIKGEWANQYPLAWYIWQACAERYQAEIVALRGALSEMKNCSPDALYWEFNTILGKFGLIDENGKPTALLTGEEE